MLSLSSCRSAPRQLWGGLLLWMALVCACQAAAPAAKVLFVRGGVVAEDSRGTSRQLQRGSHILSGDLLVTHDGMAQLRFVDGAIMSLQAGTELRIDDYRFAGRQDGHERGFFSFLKGSMRVLTGLIGHKHQDSFRIRTSVATIGIRGTGFTMKLQDRLQVTVTNGRVILFNQGGRLLLDSGETGWADSQDRSPWKQGQPAMPPVGPAGQRNAPGYRSGEDLGRGLPSPLPQQPTGTTDRIKGP